MISNFTFTNINWYHWRRKLQIYGNTKLAIMPTLPSLCDCEKLELQDKKQVDFTPQRKESRNYLVQNEDGCVMHLCQFTKRQSLQWKMQNSRNVLCLLLRWKAIAGWLEQVKLGFSRQGFFVSAAEWDKTICTWIRDYSKFHATVSNFVVQLHWVPLVRSFGFNEYPPPTYRFLCITHWQQC